MMQYANYRFYKFIRWTRMWTRERTSWLHSPPLEPVQPSSPGSLCGSSSRRVRWPTVSNDFKFRGQNQKPNCTVRLIFDIIDYKHIVNITSKAIYGNIMSLTKVVLAIFRKSLRTMRFGASRSIFCLNHHKTQQDFFVVYICMHVDGNLQISSISMEVSGARTQSSQSPPTPRVSRPWPYIVNCIKLRNVCGWTAKGSNPKHERSV